MICKRCGAALPSTGFLCTNCGFMMDAEQIKKQKELMQANKRQNNVEMISERYGKNKVLYQRREKERHSIFKPILFLFLLLLFLFGILIFVLFS